MPAQQEVKPVNCWQYSRNVYLLGRSVKFRIVSDEQRTALKDFIIGMAETRPAYVPYVNLKADNPPCNEFSGEDEQRKLAWDRLDQQNDYSLGKMIQKLGRSLKIQFCSNDEKLLCDSLFAAFAEKKEESEDDVETDDTHDKEEDASSEETANTGTSSSSETAEEEVTEP